MDTVVDVIRTGVARFASDVHITPGRPACYRINGDVIESGGPRLMTSDTQRYAEELLTPAQMDVLKEKGEIDFAYSLPNIGRFRVNAFNQRGSIALVARILNTTIPDPADLGIPDAVVALTEKKRGLILVTGATGSGKSTTLASLIGVINRKYPYHILTLEDPVEYLHQHNKSIVNQREIGNDSLTYAAALRSALRQDPDVILVGEMRDLETISIAITAAETGHLVFSTLHTVGASNTIDRIIDVFPPYQQQQIRTQLADVLECVVSQQLLLRRDGKGRIAAIEVMLANSAIRNYIREAKTFQIPSVMQTNRKLGMITMDEALYELYSRGDIRPETALNYAQDRVTLSKRVF